MAISARIVDGSVPTASWRLADSLSFSVSFENDVGLPMLWPCQGLTLLCILPLVKERTPRFSIREGSAPGSEGRN